MPIRYVFIVVALLIGFSCLFTVQEGERAVVSRFSKLVKDADKTRIYKPGLQFKIPFIDKPRFMDARLQTLDGQPDRFITSEKKDLMVDSFVKWRILDFEKFLLGKAIKFDPGNVTNEVISMLITTYTIP